MGNRCTSTAATWPRGNLIRFPPTSEHFSTLQRGGQPLILLLLTLLLTLMRLQWSWIVMFDSDAATVKQHQAAYSFILCQQTSSPMPCMDTPVHYHRGHRWTAFWRGSNEWSLIHALHRQRTMQTLSTGGSSGNGGRLLMSNFGCAPNEIYMNLYISTMLLYCYYGSYWHKGAIWTCMLL